MTNKINVVWHEGAQGGIHGRPEYSSCILLNEMFDTYDCVHWAKYENLPADADGAVIVIHGGNERNGGPSATSGDMVSTINAEAARLRWCVFIIHGDEDSGFPVKLLSHPNSHLWKQSPKPGVTKADRYPIFGYPRDCKALLTDRTKNLDWFFAGQMTHARRWELGIVLHKLSRGMFHPTMGYSQGLDRQAYYDLISRAKVVPCPAGPETPDTIRMSETLEAGGVPVLDAFSLDGVRGYWEMVFPGHPFRVVEDWTTFPAVLADILRNYEEHQRAAQLFWKNYRADFNSWLGKDLVSLGATL